MIHGMRSEPVHLEDRDGVLAEKRRSFFLYFQNKFFTKKKGNKALFSEQHFLSYYLRLTRSNVTHFMNECFSLFYPDEQKAIIQVLFPKPMNAVFQQMGKYDPVTLELVMKRKFAFCYLYGEYFDSAIFQLWQETVCVEDKYRWIPLLPVLDRNRLLTRMSLEKILECMQNIPKAASARTLCQLYEGTYLANRVFHVRLYASWRELQSKVYTNPLEAPAYCLMPYFPNLIQVYMCWASVDYNYHCNLSGILSHLKTLTEDDANQFAKELLTPPSDSVNEKAARNLDTHFAYRLQGLSESAQFNQLLGYLSSDNLVLLFRQENMHATLPVLSERMKRASDIDKQKFIQEDLLNFCYIRGRFDFKRFYPWYEKLPQSIQLAVFEMMPSQLQIAVFHYDRQACIEPLHQQVCLQDVVEEQNKRFQEIFSFCFDQGFFNLSAFRDWQQHAHPVEKHRWEDYACRFVPSVSPDRLTVPTRHMFMHYRQPDLRRGDDAASQGLYFAHGRQQGNSIAALTTAVDQLAFSEFNPSQFQPPRSRSNKGKGW